ncbi:MAG: DUF349 domain-containing protein [Bifidobacteriaceae bacterium]|nr:DUF349 domain-containing protein [Bifidobacteriaceae bacterium]
MSDETVTTPDSTKANVNADNEKKTASAIKPKAPSPAAFAKKTPKVSAPVAVQHSEEDIKNAEKFGRVSDDGTVYVKDGNDERAVGQYPDAENKEEALGFYAKRYLDLKSRVDLFISRLSTKNVKVREIDETVKTIEKETDNPEVVGDIPALRESFAKLKEKAAAKKEEISKAHAEAVEKAFEERKKIVEEAEQLAANLSDRTNWRETADKFSALFDRWQTHQKNSARLNKNINDELWKRFSAARSAFNSSRRKWAQARDIQRENVKSMKEAIIAEAEEIKNSTQWAETGRKFGELMDRWKQAGRAGRKTDDELWARFRAAADTFFNARQADRDKVSADEKENLAKKEELLAKAEALVPVEDIESAKKARTELAKIQEEWDAIGHVPRTELRRIENALDDVEKQIKEVEDSQWKKTNSETDARKSGFVAQLNAQLKELDEKIAAETDADKKAALEAEKATKQQWLNAVQ